MIMTTSHWSKQEIESKFPGCATLKDLISRIEAEFSQKGEVICEIRVNGVLLSEADESKYASQPSTEIREIAISSNAPLNLIADAIKSALVLIPDLDKSCLSTSEQFRGADLNQAQRSFHECLEGVQWLIDTLIHVRGAASGIQKPIAQPERWFEAEKLITRVVRELSEAYSGDDYVLVADLLEYELTGALSIWKTTIESETALIAAVAE